MHRYISIIALIMFCLLLNAATALAAPPIPGNGQSWFVYGEYAPDAYMFPGAAGPAIGVGRGSRGNSFGIMLQYAGDGTEAWPVYGAFGGLRGSKLLLECQALTNGEAVFGRAAALYLISERRHLLTLGGGVLAENKYGDSWFFLEAGAQFRPAKGMTVYATFDYTLDGYGDMLVKAGAGWSW